MKTREYYVEKSFLFGLLHFFRYCLSGERRCYRRLYEQLRRNFQFGLQSLQKFVCKNTSCIDRYIHCYCLFLFNTLLSSPLRVRLTRTVTSSTFGEDFFTRTSFELDLGVMNSCIQ